MYDRGVLARASRVVPALLLAVAACRPAGPTGPAVSARDWPQADGLFRAQAEWLGGDGALSIPLDDERTLWLFGDSFVATSSAHVRSESEMIRNTVAIQSGRDPTAASMRFAWRTDPDGSPAPVFADDGERWFWPGHGVRLAEGPLLVFLMAVRSTPDEGLGFTEDGFRVVLVDDPDRPVQQWSLEAFDPPGPAADPAAALGIAVLREGPWLYAYATAHGSRHVGWLARLSLDDVLARRIEPQWWEGDDRWSPAAELGAREPAVVIDEIGSECSLHFEPRLDAYLHVTSRGFGPSTVAIRTAPAPTGPFSAPRDVFTPEESRQQEPEPFVYAAKAHPELRTSEDDELVITYATNTFEFWDLFSEPGLQRYWPRFVRLRLEP